MCRKNLGKSCNNENTQDSHSSLFLFDSDPDFYFYLMRIRILIFTWCGSGVPKWCGSGSTTGEFFHVVFLDAGEHCILYIVYYILYIVYCLLYIVYCMYIVYCISQAALDHLLHCLTRFHTIFQRHGLDPEIIGQANIFLKKGDF